MRKATNGFTNNGSMVTNRSWSIS